MFNLTKKIQKFSKKIKAIQEIQDQMIKARIAAGWRFIPICYGGINFREYYYYLEKRKMRLKKKHGKLILKRLRVAPRDFWGPAPYREKSFEYQQQTFENLTHNIVLDSLALHLSPLFKIKPRKRPMMVDIQRRRVTTLEERFCCICNIPRQKTKISKIYLKNIT